MNWYSFSTPVSDYFWPVAEIALEFYWRVTWKAFCPLLVQAEVFCVPSLSSSPKAIPFTGLITRAAHCDTSWLTLHHFCCLCPWQAETDDAVRTCCTPLTMEQSGSSLLLPYTSRRCLVQQFYTPCSLFDLRCERKVTLIRSLGFDFFWWAINVFSSIVLNMWLSFWLF